jgi:hypothetical protein
MPCSNAQQGKEVIAMTTATLERPFGVDLMTPVGEMVNAPALPEMKTGYTTTYEFMPGMAKDQKKDDDEDE